MKTRNKQTFICVSVLAVVLVGSFVIWSNSATRGSANAQAQFEKVASWDEAEKQAMFEQDPDALAAELNKIEPVL